MWGRGKRLEATNYSNFGDSIQMIWAISLGQRFVTCVYQAESDYATVQSLH